MKSPKLSEDQKINLGFLGLVLLKFKYSILLFFVVGLIIAAVVAFFKPISYTSVITMEVAEEKNQREDTLALALGDVSSNFANEKEIITSRYLIEKALKNLELGRRYFVKQSLRQIELYKNSPFIVSVSHFDRKLYGHQIYLLPVDDEHFVLEIRKGSIWTKRGLKDLLDIDKSERIEFQHQYEYGKEINSPWFTIKVDKVFSLRKDEYSFSVMPNEAMYYHIRGGLKASLTNRQGSIVAISYRDNVALRARDVVQAIADAYMTDKVEKKRQSAEEILKFIDGELEDLNVHLNESANKLKTFKQDNEIADLESSAKSIKNKIAENDAKLSEIYLEEEMLGGIQEYVKSGKDLSGLAINETLLSNSNLVTKIKKYQELSELSRQYLASYTEFHPDVIKVKNELVLIKENIEYILETSLKNLQHKKSWLIENNKKLSSSLHVLPQQERKLSNLTRNFQVNEKIYQYLLERRSETAILQASTISKTRVIDTPMVPGPNPSKKTFIVIVGAMLGLFFGVLQAYIRHVLKNTISEPSEVEEKTSLTIVGRIPYKVKGRYTLVYEEAFRTLRTNLEFLTESSPCKKVLVTSSISGEGKSTTVKNLAQMLIKLDKRVVVLDFDLRRPSLHKDFQGIDNSKGLSLLLSGQSSLQENIQQTKEGIDILTSGPLPPNPSELIMSDTTKLLLQSLSKNYDYILLDSPPYGVVTDAAILMKEVDVTLFSIMLEYSKRDIFKYMNQAIEKYALKHAAVIVHGLTLKRQEKQGYGYYDIN